MLIPLLHKGIYEKIVRAADGRLVRVQFTVIEANGVLRGRVISMEPIFQVGREVAVSAGALCLPLSIHKDIACAVEVAFTKESVSPYTSLDFFMSQPTRAPSHN